MANFQINNLSIVNRALQQVEPKMRQEMTTELHAIGSLVARDAQALASVTIRRITPSWTLMRVGQTRSLIYVVPRNKGVRGRGPKRRPNFAPLMLNRAMRPALQRKKPEVNRRFGIVVSTVCGAFNNGKKLG